MKPSICVAVLAALLPGSLHLHGASWTSLKNPIPTAINWPMILLTDGTVIVHGVDDATWYRLTPDAHGSYVNGSWTQAPSSRMNSPRLDFASQVLPNGKVWVLGGEYSGPGLPQNDGYLGEIFDPIANTWSPVSPFPNMTGCFVSQFGGQVTAGSPVMTGILSTAGWRTGWTVTPTSGTPVPAGTVIAGIDSPTQIHLSANATISNGIAFTLNSHITGNTTAGSKAITGVSSTAGIQYGFDISGPGIPSGAIVTNVTSANSLTISANATASGTGVLLSLLTWLQPASCAGDLISILVPGPKILTGSNVNSNTYLYDPVADNWSQGAAKVYSDSSSEEGWARLADGSIVNYDLNYSNAKGKGYAERYDPVANKWSPISPADGTAQGTLPLLGLGGELGPLVRLYDDRVFVIGGNGHTALYTPSTNTWSAGPDMMGTLGGQPFRFAADDAPAAVLPNGHVILSGDAGNGISSSGTVTAGSPEITGIPSTAQLVAAWKVSGSGIPSGATIKSIDSPSQVTLSANATAGGTGVAIEFGGIFSTPIQIFDFDPATDTMSPVSPPLNDPALNRSPGYVIGMLMLPTGQVLVSDGTNQLYVYTSDGPWSPSLQPSITSIAANGAGVFTLTGTGLNGQSAGASYGDDEQNDTSFPAISMTSASGSVYYARTTNWSYIGVAGGSTPETVDFTLNPQVVPGMYSLVVSGAGIQSNPVSVMVSSNLGTITLDPAPVGVNTGSSQTGTSQTMTFTFTDPRGWQDLDVVNVLINNFLDGRSACYLAYSRTAGILYLVGDDGGTLFGLPLNGSGSVSNSQCTVAGVGSSVSGSGNTLTLTLNLSFTPAFAGYKIIYMAARDLEGDNPGWNALGTWTVPGLNPFPLPASVSPAAGASSSQTFTFVFSDTKGATDLGVVNVLINNFLDGRSACYLAYSQPFQVLYLVGDAGGGLSSGLTLGGSGSISNSQCTVNASSSSAVTSGNTLTLTLDISFASGFAGGRVIYMAARDSAGVNNSGWQAMGSWMVP